MRAFREGSLSLTCSNSSKGYVSLFSRRGTINLNAQLLLIPRQLVRYVFLHGLCHAVHSITPLGLGTCFNTTNRRPIAFGKNSALPGATCRLGSRRNGERYGSDPILCGADSLHFVS